MSELTLPLSKPDLFDEENSGEQLVVDQSPKTIDALYFLDQGICVDAQQKVHHCCHNEMVTSFAADELPRVILAGDNEITDDSGIRRRVQGIYCCFYFVIIRHDKVYCFRLNCSHLRRVRSR